jgi:hypothetical protein
MATPKRKARPKITKKAIKTAKPRKKPAPKTAKKSRISTTKKKGTEVAKVGRPPHKVEDFNRGKVQVMAGYGAKHEDIALSLGICVTTLVKHYKRELDIGAIEANNVVMGSMMTQIKMMMPGSAALIIWWTKCKMGWHEGHTESEDAIQEYAKIRDPGELAKLTAQELVTLYREEISTRQTLR